VWGCAALFYGFQFVLRVSPNVIAHDLMDSLTLDACMLGALSSFYYYGYAFMQIPSGLLLDRLGPRLPLVFACLMCTLGSVIFGYVESFPLLALGRTFMGIGSAFAFLSCIKLISLYFEVRFLSILVGLTLTVGTIGATAGNAPFGMLVDSIGWRNSHYVLGTVSLMITLIAWFVIPENHLHRTPKNAHKVETLRRSLKSIALNPQTWLYGFYGFAMYVPLSGFADLWGTPFVMETYKIKKTVAAGATSLFYVGLGFGAPAWSYYANRVKSYKKSMMYSALASTLFVTILLYVPIPFTLMHVLMALAGFCVGGQFSSFSGVASLNPLHRTATASGVHNMMCMLSGVVMQPLIGLCLVFCKQNDPQCLGVVSRYAQKHFLQTLSIIPLFLVVACIITCFMKETFPQNTQKT
jgi:MFS family permease